MQDFYFFLPGSIENSACFILSEKGTHCFRNDPTTCPVGYTPTSRPVTAVIGSSPKNGWMFLRNDKKIVVKDKVKAL